MFKTVTVALLLLLVVSCADLAEDQPLHKYNNTVVLIAGTGFYDPKTFSLVNLFNTSSFIHGSPDFCICGFYDKIRYTPRRDKFTDAQIQITLNKLEPKNIAVNIHFVEIDLCGSNQAYFLSTIDNDAGSIDTIRSKIEANTKVISLKTTKPSPSGTYYINSMGINPNGNCNFSVNRVTADYIEAAKK
jgi:hypothetical protein